MITDKIIEVQEREANMFAMFLLVPDDMLVKDMSSGKYDLSDDSTVARLARRYDVSKEVMAARLALSGYVGHRAQVIK